MDQDDKQVSKGDIWDEIDREEAGEPAAETSDDSPAAERKAEKVEIAEDKQAEPKGAAEKSVEQVEDPDRDLPQPVRDRLAGYKAILDSQEKRLRQAFGKIGELNSKLGSMPATKAAPASDDAKQGGGAMDKLKADYPDFASALDAALAERLQNVVPQNVATRDELAAVAREAAVEAAHPGWKARVATPEFQGWLTRQPDEVKALAASAQPADAIRLLGLERDERAGARAEPAPREDINQKRLKAAALIPSRGSRTQRGISLDEMTDAQVWDHFDKIDAAKRGLDA